MTRERAIEVLKAWDLNWSDEFTANEFEQAFAMAISALSENKGDLISRKSLLNKINAYAVGSQDKEFICKLIKEMPSVENKGEWIPVSERLPKERQAVLCWAKSTAERLDAEFIGMYDTGDWFLQSDANHLSFPHQYNVVAWMPLPSPWKGE